MSPNILILIFFFSPKHLKNVKPLAHRLYKRRPKDDVWPAGRTEGDKKTT